MGIYWLIVCVIFITGFLIQPNRSNLRKKTFIIMTFLILTIVSGWRAFTVGADTKTYIGIFNSIDYLETLKSRFEIGFLYYVYILHKISNNAGILLIVSSVFCIGVACIFTYKYSKNPVLSMILYVLLGAYFLQMNAMRQALAMSILMLSFILLFKDNMCQKVISIFLIIVAVTFHTVAIVGIVPWLLIVRSNGDEKSHNNFTERKIFKWTIIVSIVAFVAYSVIMIVVSKLFPMYSGYFYGEWSDANYNASLFNTLIQLVFSVFGVFVFRNKRLSNIQRFSAIMISLTIIFNVLSMRMEIWGRVAGLFGIYTYLIWVPEITYEISSIRNRLIWNMIIVLFCSLYMWIVLTYRPEWTLVVPYKLR